MSTTTQKKFIPFEKYTEIYYKTEDGFKYEWNNGTIEKTESRKQSELPLINILMRLFTRTNVFQNGGVLGPIDMWTSTTQYRRPDIAVYLSHQLPEMVRGTNEIAQWIGEIISPNDTATQINNKLAEYFSVGVQCIWHIYPESEQVNVFTSLDEITICSGKKICSAEPALKKFEIKAEDIFAYKKHLKKEA